MEYVITTLHLNSAPCKGQANANADALLRLNSSTLCHRRRDEMWKTELVILTTHAVDPELIGVLTPEETVLYCLTLEYCGT